MTFDQFLDNNILLARSAAYGKFKQFKNLLENEKVDPTYNDNYPIRMACQGGSIKIVKLLLAIPEVDPSDCDNYAILMASKNRNHKIISLLLDDKRVIEKLKYNKLLKHDNIKVGLILKYKFIYTESDADTFLELL